MNDGFNDEACGADRTNKVSELCGTVGGSNGQVLGSNEEVSDHP